MQKISNKVFIIFALLSFIFALASCTGGDSKNNLKLLLEQNEYQIEVGEEVKLIPTIENGTEGLELVWTSYDNSVVTVDNGTLTGVSVGKTTVKVHVAGQQSVAAKATIKVVGKDGKPLASFNKVPQALGINETFQLECSPSNQEQQLTITYSSIVEDVLSVTETGLITALKLGEGAIDIKVVDSETNQFVNYRFIILVKDNYKITYELNGGTNNDKNPLSYLDGSQNVILQAPTKDGYIFKGWYLDNSFNNEITEIDTNLKEDVTVYAKWADTYYVKTTTFEEGVAYKLAIEQLGLNKTLWLTGEMSGFYGASTENEKEAAYVYLEAVDGGYNLKVKTLDGTIKYINAEISGKHKNFVLDTQPKSVWNIEESKNALVTILEEETAVYIGTYDSYKTFSLSTVDHMTSATAYVANLYEPLEYTDDMKVADILKNFKILETHYQDYTLPTTIEEYLGSKLSWTLEETSQYLTIDNENNLKVTRPAFGEEDAKVTLTVTCTLEKGTASKDFIITVLAKSNVEVATEIDTNKTYKFAVYQGNLEKTIFFTGKMDDRNFALTDENPLKGIDVKVAIVEGGYQLTTTIDDKTKYIELADKGTYAIITFIDTPTELVWTYDDINDTFTTVIGEKTYYMGGNDTFSTLRAQSIETIAENFPARLYEVTYTKDNYNDYLNEITVQTSITADYELPKDSNIVWSLKEDSLAATLDNGVVKVNRQDVDTDIIVVAQFDSTEYTKEFTITIKAKETETGGEETEYLQPIDGVYTIIYKGETPENTTNALDYMTLFNLNPVEFNVIGTKNNNNFPGVNKDGTIRLYKKGNTNCALEFQYLLGNIIKIEIESSTLSDLKITASGSEITGTNGVYSINSDSFKIENISDNTVKITSIKIFIN